VNFFKIISTEGRTIDIESKNFSSVAKHFTGIFFLIHYGGFHFVYLIFLFIFSIQSNIPIDFLSAFFVSILFLVNHVYSFFANQDWKTKGAGQLMGEPYGRIFPMHLSIIFFGIVFALNPFPIQGETIVLVFFLIIKTAIDLFSHLSEHNLINKTKN